MKLSVTILKIKILKKTHVQTQIMFSDTFKFDNSRIIHCNIKVNYRKLVKFKPCCKTNNIMYWWDIETFLYNKKKSYSFWISSITHNSVNVLSLYASFFSIILLYYVDLYWSSHEFFHNHRAIVIDIGITLTHGSGAMLI